jgi:hypothetical protein
LEERIIKWNFYLFYSLFLPLDFFVEDKVEIVVTNEIMNNILRKEKSIFSTGGWNISLDMLDIKPQ